ncbi:DUF465 domain-containing protein [Porphyrobacter algicida]|uniref:DUF465 domain-containing protein n=1 Tax=Qipengyuania algicida TaxID=1836209 RepID=A0A845AFV1_9SPHN|nr:YdcH family protein [Qipengyuania algicida]MXP29432.1 DUF465 domain-containing protein [Qipengyuania algicida]
MTHKSPDEKIMKPYLCKLMREHRALNRMIDTTKALGASEQVKAMKRVRIGLKDKIAALQRHYYGRGLVG